MVFVVSLRGSGRRGSHCECGHCSVEGSLGVKEEPGWDQVLTALGHGPTEPSLDPSGLTGGSRHRAMVVQRLPVSRPRSTAGATTLLRHRQRGAWFAGCPGVVVKTPQSWSQRTRRESPRRTKNKGKPTVSGTQGVSGHCKGQWTLKTVCVSFARRDNPGNTRRT